jgi:hypothetical protein
MPQLRWTLLLLGVLFVILLAWIEHRRQRRQGFTDHPPVDKEVGESSPPPMLREPILSLPEMRAAREAGPPQELPVVEIEEDSLDPRRIEGREGRIEPPTLSLPVLESGPLTPRARTAEPAVSSFDSVLKPGSLDARAKVLGDTSSLGDRAVSEGTPSGGEGKSHRDANLSGVTTERSAKESPAGTTERSATERSAREPPAGARESPAITPVAERRIPRLDTPAPRAAARLSELGDNEERAFNEAVFGDSGLAVSPEPDERMSASSAEEVADEEDEAPTDAESTSADGNSDPDPGSDAQAADQPPRFTAADVTPIKDPIVEWPPDEQRRVVALRLVAAQPERLAGRALRLALASEGFVLGKFQIFHKPDESGRAVLSAASLSKPGTFELETMDLQRYGGLNLFAVLPGPKPPLKAFEDLLSTARSLNERLQGALQDERGGPLTPTRVASLRESLAAETTP